MRGELAFSFAQMGDVIAGSIPEPDLLRKIRKASLAMAAGHPKPHFPLPAVNQRALRFFAAEHEMIRVRSLVPTRTQKWRAIQNRTANTYVLEISVYVSGSRTD